ncbi:unnamed protein product [Laminaria digitata]
MTALKLEKTVALLGLGPRRIVAQGLAPRRLLKGGKGGSSPLALAGESSGTGDEELRKAETGALMDGENENENHIISNSNSSSNSSEDEEEHEEEEVGQEDKLFSDDSNSTYDDHGDKSDAEGNGKAINRRPIHAALAAGGINLRPRETTPLLRALGVSPQRLVKLGLVKREALGNMTGRRGGGPGQHLRAGGPGKRGVGGPRGPPNGPPHAHAGGRAPGCGLPGPMHGPPRRPFHGTGPHPIHQGEEGEEEGMSVPLGPHGGPGHLGPRHQGGPLEGPPHGPGQHSSMPTGRHARGPPGGRGGKHGRGPPGGCSGKHGHGYRHPPHEHGHGHAHEHDGGGLHGEIEGEGGERLWGGARGPGQHGPRQHEGGMGRPRGPPPAHYDCCGPSSDCGPSRPMHGPPRGLLYGAGRHSMQLREEHLGEESEEQEVFTSLGPHGGPGHRDPSHHGGGGGGGMGRSRGRPQGPHHGPFHGPFDEGASGAPPGLMAHPHHPRHGSPPSPGRDGMQRRGDGLRGGDMQHRRMAHLARFDGRHQPQLEAC